MRRFALLPACALAALATAPGPAGAEVSGGAAAASPVVVDALRCTAVCAADGAAAPGSTVRVLGRGLGRARTVVFLGGRGRADDVPAKVLRSKPTAADVVVPDGALGGRVRVFLEDGAMSRAGTATIAVQQAAAPPPVAGAGGPVAASVAARKVFFDGEQPATLQLAPAAGPVAVGVELVRTKDGASIAKWRPGVLQPGAPAQVSWDGLAGGRVQREGRYEFRVFARDAAPGETSAPAPGSATSAQAPLPADPAATTSFVFLRHAFPVQGVHGFGEFAASFGGGRGHQGQDVFADCGTPLVAARGGTVRWKAFQARAGNYLVIDGEATGTDYTYMHLRDPALLDVGQPVKTGQLIGYVGQTGRAHGCHLHFEMWSAPGWYRGGAAVDPLPSLRAWDKSS